MLKCDFDAAIFDMDGTLLDTMRYWRFTTLEFLLAHRIPVKDEDLVRMLDTSSRKFLYEIAERDGIDIGERADVVRELEDYMNHHYLHHAQLKDDFVKPFLEMLKENGVRMCVATAAPCKYGRNGLERLGILDYFDFLVDNYTAEDGLTKDKPEYFVRLAKRLGTTPERCMVFEDALYSMKSAKAAGCRVIAIEDITARRTKDSILETAERYILSYSELL